MKEMTFYPQAASGKAPLRWPGASYNPHPIIDDDVSTKREDLLDSNRGDRRCRIASFTVTGGEGIRHA
jgi:hypothetical protein